MTAADVRDAEIEAPDQIVYLPIESLVPDPENRPVTDEDTDELLASVLEHGVLEPILATRLDEEEWGIVDGEVRWRTARRAGLLFIQAIVRDSYADKRRWVEASTIANLARIDPHPLDQGHRFAMLRELGHTQASISQLVGSRWSQPVVSKRLDVIDALALLDDDLRSSVEKAYRRGDLNVRQAERLADLVALAPELPDDVPGLVSYLVFEVAGPDHRRGELDKELERLVKDAGRLRDVRKARAAVAADGLRDVTDEPTSSWVAMRDLTRQLDDPLKGHDKLPCAAVYVTSFGEITSVCTDPQSHRPAGDDDGDQEAALDALANVDLDDEERIPSQDEIAEAEQAAAAKRKASPEAQVEAQRRATQREYVAGFIAAEPARLEAARNAIAVERSKTVALNQLVAIIANDYVVDDYGKRLFDVLGLSLGDDQTFGDAVREYVAAGGDGVARFALALAFALGEQQLNDTVSSMGEDDDPAKIGAIAHVEFLKLAGYEPNAAELASVYVVPADVEAAVASPPEPDAGSTTGPLGACRGCPTFVPIDESGHLVEHEHMGQRCDGSGHTPVPLDQLPEIASAEWAEFVAARAALIEKKPPTRKVNERFEVSKHDLATALVASHPDVFELTSNLAAITSSFRESLDDAHRDQVPAAAENALIETAARSVLAELQRAGKLPADLVDDAVHGHDLLLVARPESKKPGQVRHLYVDDLLDAAQARP